ncbi:MAG: N-acetyltransferase [Gemmatimonadetes bacterium]|nr:N-acetyltransferase [Gemmatimonadota bacterium]
MSTDGSSIRAGHPRTDPTHSVRGLAPEDWAAVARIYGEGMATGHATFETAVPAWEEWDARHVKDPRLVAVSRISSPEIHGFAALSAVSARAVYAGVAEVSVYVTAAARGQGVGTRLLDALVERAEAAGFWTLQAGIFPENEASLALHARAGFRTVGRRERIGRLHGVWRDVLLLERRSTTVGTESEEAAG